MLGDLVENTEQQGRSLREEFTDERDTRLINQGNGFRRRRAERRTRTHRCVRARSIRTGLGDHTGRHVRTWFEQSFWSNRLVDATELFTEIVNAVQWQPCKLRHRSVPAVVLVRQFN